MPPCHLYDVAAACQHPQMGWPEATVKTLTPHGRQWVGLIRYSLNARIRHVLRQTRPLQPDA